MLLRSINRNNSDTAHFLLRKNLIPKYPNIVSVPFKDPVFPAQIMLIYNPHTIGEGFVKSFRSYIKQFLK